METSFFGFFDQKNHRGFFGFIAQVFLIAKKLVSTSKNQALRECDIDWILEIHIEYYNTPIPMWIRLGTMILAFGDGSAMTTR